MLFTTPPNDFPTASRIISVVPSLTEFLFHLGLHQETLAITRFCVHPNEWFRSKTRIGGTKQLHLEAIKNLQPDLLIASREENIREQIEYLSDSIPIYLTDVEDLNSALTAMQNIGILTGTAKRANEVCDTIQSRFAEISVPHPIPAAYLIWKDPYMVAGGGTFINDMLKRAGFQNVFDGTNRYPQVNLKQIADSEAKLVLLSSEPYPFKEHHLSELQPFLPGKKLMCVDGEMFSWYGSRMLKAPAYFQHFRESILI